MNISTGFHAQYPTSIEAEIRLAGALHGAALMRWGIWKLPRMMRTDPAAVFAKMAYCRIVTNQGDITCAHGIPLCPETRGTNEKILTPSHNEWEEFRERLESHLACPDFADYYAPANENEYWPLCSAQLVSQLGFAVAESLCCFRCYIGDDDDSIAKHVESLWRKQRPSKTRPAFDADSTAAFVRHDVPPAA